MSLSPRAVVPLDHRDPADFGRDADRALGGAECPRDFSFEFVCGLSAAAMGFVTG